MGTAAPFCLSYGSFWLDLEAKFQHPFGCIKLPHILVWNCKRHNDYMLDNMCLGPYMFWKSIVLRDSMLVGTLLSCSEAWYNVSEAELGQIEQVDKSLWCNLLEGARTVPYDLICLELGVEPLCFIIIRKRLSYLQHILKQKESSLFRQFLMTQSINPRNKDWVSSIKEDLKQLEINLIFVQIEEMGKFTYKRLIKKKTKESAFRHLIERKSHRNG